MREFEGIALDAGIAGGLTARRHAIVPRLGLGKNPAGEIAASGGARPGS